MWTQGELEIMYGAGVPSEAILFRENVEKFPVLKGRLFGLNFVFTDGDELKAFHCCEAQDKLAIVGTDCIIGCVTKITH